MKFYPTEIVENIKQTKSNINIARISARFITAFGFLVLCWSAGFAQGSVKGHGGQMPAFYEGEQITISSFQLPPSETLEAQNQSVNNIYVTNDLDDPQDFKPVIDAITGHQDERFNPLWEQIMIVFNPGVTPRQFTSEDEVLDAAGAGQITLVDTGEVYRCSVVGGH